MDDERELEIKDGYVVKVNKSDYKRLVIFKWKKQGNYVYASIKGKYVSMQRFIMGFPKGDVHHKDGDTFNNLRENLVALTRKEHMCIHAAYRKRARRGHPELSKWINDNMDWI